MTDEELLSALKERFLNQGPQLWVVWTEEPRPGGRLKLALSEQRLLMLVVARNASEARKVWRQYVFDAGGDVPRDCEVKSVPMDLEPCVISQEVSTKVLLKLEVIPS